jgi:hypothetical protein
MSELRKQLAGRALDKAVPYTWTKLDYEQIHELLQCHAELCVKECTDRIYNAMKNTDHSDLVYNAMLTALIADIQESFGIQESKSQRFARAIESIFKNGADLSGKDTP